MLIGEILLTAFVVLLAENVGLLLPLQSVIIPEDAAPRAINAAPADDLRL